MHTFLSNSLELLDRLARAYGQELDISRGRTRLTCDAYDRACATLSARIADPAFALRAAELWHPSDFGTLGYAWFASTCLRTALERLVRYRRVIGERGVLMVRDASEGLWLSYAHGRADDATNRLGSEIVLSVVLALCRRNYGQPLVPEWVSLRGPAPADRAPYDAFFGCPVEFQAQQNALLLPYAVVDVPLSTSNREVASALDVLLTRQLAELDSQDLVACCRSVLLEALTSGTPDAKTIARQLFVSERTLQRRLAEQHTSFQELVDETRRDMAMRYLEDGSYTVTEVAFLVGFSNSSALSRAFVRWAGMSPTHWRERAVKAEGGAAQIQKPALRRHAGKNGNPALRAPAGFPPGKTGLS
ncbi:MAG TPA: AraC family transcriptional regulator [Rhodocyclaceae bacterium]|nr:AraC family transcriptional regulator [Rhodocyclaceae bacterium]